MYGEGDPWAPLHLSHVCSRWRALLLLDSTEWAVTPIAAYPEEEMMLEYARWAGLSPLKLRVVNEDP